MIRRKIIFSSDEPLNNGYTEKNEDYRKNNISNPNNEESFDENESEHSNMEYSRREYEMERSNTGYHQREYEMERSNTEYHQREHEMHSSIDGSQSADEMLQDSINSRLDEILNENSVNDPVCIFNDDCDRVIERTNRYLSEQKNCVVLGTIEMDKMLGYDIYQCVMAQIYQNITDRRLSRSESYGLNYFYEKAEMLFENNNVGYGDYENAFSQMRKLNILNRRPKIFKEAVNIFLGELGERNAKLIVPMCFYFSPIDIDTFDLINKAKSNNIVFVLGTMISYELEMGIIGDSRVYLDRRNVFN